MADWRRKHWQGYNVVSRVLGIGALVSGSGFVGLSADVGTAILTTPAYRPGLGDRALEFDPYGLRNRQTSRAGESW